jgi:hypothetical protein
MPPSLEEIEYAAFSKCNGLRDVMFASDSELRYIGPDAFANCRSLCSLDLPPGTSLAGTAFRGSGVSEIRLPDGDDPFPILEDCMLVATVFGKEQILVRYSGIHSQVTGGFGRYQSVAPTESAVSALGPELGSPYRSLAAYDLRGFSSLVSISVPDSVTIFPYGCCAFCQSLKRLKFGQYSKLVKFESNLFEGCASLGSIRIPALVTSIAGAAFIKCPISTIEICPYNLHFRHTGDCLMRVDELDVALIHLYGQDPHPIIPAICTEICGCAFSMFPGITGCGFEPGSELLKIGDYAFSELHLLQSICFPSSVETLCWRCFSSCSSLREVRFERDSRLQKMESEVFRGCLMLGSFWIPRLVSSIAVAAFAGSSLSEIHISDENENFCSFGKFIICKKTGSLFQYFGRDRIVQIPSHITRIQAHAFSTFQDVSLLIFEGDCVFEDDAFVGLRSLTSICRLPISDAAVSPIPREDRGRDVTPA